MFSDFLTCIVESDPNTEIMWGFLQNIYLLVLGKIKLVKQLMCLYLWVWWVFVLCLLVMIWQEDNRRESTDWKGAVQPDKINKYNINLLSTAGVIDVCSFYGVKYVLCSAGNSVSVSPVFCLCAAEEVKGVIPELNVAVVNVNCWVLTLGLQHCGVIGHVWIMSWKKSSKPPVEANSINSTVLIILVHLLPLSAYTVFSLSA